MIAGCNSSYDDSAIWDEFAAMNERMERLEQQCNLMNTNLVALQNIVQALMSHDYITNLSPITTDGQIVGYTITFSKSGSITILNGTDGKDGHTPQIGVRQASDGIYYWTIDGEWLHDEDGNRIKAAATSDATNGITPKLKIEDGWWYVSYDEGRSWERLGKAHDTSPSNSIFTSITQDQNNVYFHLTDGTTITIPRHATLSLRLDMSRIDRFLPNSHYEIAYTVEGCSERVEIEVSSSADIMAKVEADDYTQLSGVIHIQTSDKLTEFSKVIVFVGYGQSVIMQTITFEDEKLQILNGSTKHISKSGGHTVLEFMTNVKCEVNIPETARSWISVAEPTRAAYPNAITLTIAENKGSTRSATVAVESIDGSLRIEYSIIQESADLNQPSANELWYTSTDRKIISPYDPAAFGAAITSNVYDARRGAILFDRAITKIGEQAFMNVARLTEVTLPEGVTTIGQSAFRRCSSLTKFLTPQSLKSIESSAFLRCDALSELILNEQLSTIGDDAFAYCSALTSVTMPASLQSIGYGAFANCSSLTTIIIEATTPPLLSDNVFQKINPEATIYVPIEATDKYKEAQGWKEYAQIIVGQ